jgi:hypothetical protein
MLLMVATVTETPNILFHAAIKASPFRLASRLCGQACPRAHLKSWLPINRVSLTPCFSWVLSEGLASQPLQRFSGLGNRPSQIAYDFRCTNPPIPLTKRFFKKSHFFKISRCKSLSVSCLKVKLTVSFSSCSECDTREAMKTERMTDGGRKKESGKHCVNVFVFRGQARSFLELFGTIRSYLELFGDFWNQKRNRKL